MTFDKTQVLFWVMLEQGKMQIKVFISLLLHDCIVGDIFYIQISHSILHCSVFFHHIQQEGIFSYQCSTLRHFWPIRCKACKRWSGPSTTSTYMIFIFCSIARDVASLNFLESSSKYGRIILRILTWRKTFSPKRQSFSVR